jgi:glycosyltransferase involved in cell wall biosynthesis
VANPVDALINAWPKSSYDLKETAGLSTNMKNLWIINHYAQEPGNPGGTRHYSIARHLVKYGWQASLIASSFDVNARTQRISYHERTRLSHAGGVPFLRVRTPGYDGNGAGRIWNMLSYSFRVLLPSSTKQLQRPDVIVGSSVHPLAALSGAVLARRFRVPFVFEVRDLWPQTLVDFGRLRENSPTTKALRWLERWLYNRADQIVVLLPRADEYICLLGVPKDKIVWIPNGVDLEGYPEPSQPRSRNEFTLMYFGAHGQANGLDNLLRAMAHVEQMKGGQHVRLRLIGDGPTKRTLVQFAEALRLRNVLFEEPVPKSEVPLLAEGADAFVLTIDDLPELYRYGVSPNKLFDYFAAARPTVIAADIPNNPVAEAQAGLVVPPGNPKALADAIVTLANMPLESRMQMANAGRDYVKQNHSFANLALRLARTLDKACAEYVQ